MTRRTRHHCTSIAAGLLITAAAAAQAPEPIRDARDRQMQIQLRTSALAGEFADVLSMLEQAGATGPDDALLASIESQLSGLSQREMKLAVRQLELAAQPAEGMDASAARAAQVHQARAVERLRVLLTEYRSRQSIADLAERFGKLADRQAALKEDVEQIIRRAGEKPIETRKLRDQRDVQIELRAEAVALTEQLGVQARSSSATTARTLRAAADQLERGSLSSSLEAASRELERGRAREAVDQQSTAGSALRELAKTLHGEAGATENNSAAPTAASTPSHAAALAAAAESVQAAIKSQAAASQRLQDELARAAGDGKGGAATVSDLTLQTQKRATAAQESAAAAVRDAKASAATRSAMDAAQSASSAAIGKLTHQQPEAALADQQRAMNELAQAMREIAEELQASDQPAATAAEMKKLADTLEAAAKSAADATDRLERAGDQQQASDQMEQVAGDLADMLGQAASVSSSAASATASAMASMQEASAAAQAGATQAAADASAKAQEQLAAAAASAQMAAAALSSQPPAGDAARQPGAPASAGADSQPGDDLRAADDRAAALAGKPGDAGVANLPDRDRAALQQSQRRRYSADYAELIEQYTRSLSESRLTRSQSAEPEK